MLKSMYIGTSIAISWAWGTSLILGMQIAQQKGLEAFGIWATANCLTLGKILNDEVVSGRKHNVYGERPVKLQPPEFYVI